MKIAAGRGLAGEHTTASASRPPVESIAVIAICRGVAMKVNVKQGLKTDVASALKLCTEQKSQEAVYGKLPGSNLKIKREGKAPNVRLRVSRTMPANPPAAIKRLVPATNEVSHTEAWHADGNGHVADIASRSRAYR